MSLPEFIATEQTDDAIVIAIKDHMAEVAVDPRCTGTKQCGTCAACHQSKSVLKLKISVPTNEQLVPGKTVRIHRFLVNEALSAGIIFGLPILGALAASIVAAALGLVQTDSPNLFFAAAAGFVAGALIAAIVEVVVNKTLPPSFETSEATFQ